MILILILRGISLNVYLMVMVLLITSTSAYCMESSTTDSAMRKRDNINTPLTFNVTQQQVEVSFFLNQLATQVPKVFANTPYTDSIEKQPIIFLRKRSAALKKQRKRLQQKQKRLLQKINALDIETAIIIEQEQRIHQQLAGRIDSIPSADETEKQQHVRGS